MSNKYWGWGLEDDEFYVRLKDAGLKVHRPQNITTGITDTFNHIHDRAHRRRDTVKCFNQKEETRKRDTKTGLDTIKYSISDRQELAIDGVKVTVLSVNLQCDKKVTPWCDCSEAPKETTKKTIRKGL
jgi:xylosylprotein 4-beta-galactosyltransferase